MIKFFRIIRQRMLVENRVSRYMLYAIGEILLVVIGILIALGINNWNEGKKENKEQGYLLTHLKEEFINDSINLQTLIMLSAIKVDAGKELKKMLESPSQQLDTLLLRVFYNGRLLQFNSYTPTFDEIVTSGKSKILKGDTLKTLIKSYKYSLQRIQNVLYLENQRRKEAYNSHIYKYFEPEIDTYLRRNWPNLNPNELSDFDYDIANFILDPMTIYHINIQVGLDAQLSYTFENSLMPQIETILDVLRKEELNN